MISLRMPSNPPASILNIAHRGARAFAPENTLAAFEKAQAFACQLFEMDVRLSKDGELVVCHDELLTRCTDVKAKFPNRDSHFIWDYSLDELSTLDAGSWYVAELLLPPPLRQTYLQALTEDELVRYVSPQDLSDYASGEIRLPTLQQTLALAQRTGLMVNIELKSQPSGNQVLVAAVVKLVKAMGMTDRVLLSSFDHSLLVAVRALTDTIATAVLTADRLEGLTAYLQKLDADAYHPNGYGVDEATGKPQLNFFGITEAREQGRLVNVWTCNDEDDMRQLIAAGASGIISDFPNRVQAVLSAPLSLA
ncbi:MAG: glycerophosphodiester phosphodiesterase family protein [Methylococcales bacterium]|nr:glycerophosphodiester phosphodiesterase family protein [Methylococcales bacterium]